MAIYPSSPHWMERGQGWSQLHPAPKSLVCSRLLIFIVTNNGETNEDKHRMPSRQQMPLKAEQPVQTALTEWSQITAPALDAIELLAKECIDRVAAMSTGLCSQPIKAGKGGCGHCGRAWLAPGVHTLGLSLDPCWSGWVIILEMLALIFSPSLGMGFYIMFARGRCALFCHQRHSVPTVYQRPGSCELGRRWGTQYFYWLF